ncbi:MAG TPA: UvrD-helicase domain-containing protein [Terriglobales bacterium]|nr:UvrD-helicase domain-containing protein [Terriglobales bacterium]
MDLSKLNPQQREAVEHVNGPVLILAGAGSGKTRVITHRIAHLIDDQGVAPDSILAVTFTNKAAAEMGERVSRLIGHVSVAQPRISTFHSFCVRMLRRDIEALRINGQGLTKDFAIYDEADQQSLVKAAIRRLGIDDKQLTPRIVLGRISWAKNHMRDPQEVYLQSADPNTERVAHIYEIYRKELLKANALDFDDLLLEAVLLLKSSAEVRRRYNQRYQYILIDEYQDTNRPQYELMKLLAGDHHNVCVVGDEDQSIYSWRGADIKNILEFERDFPEVKIIRLEQNYRSTQQILEGASAVVANNKQRKGKTLWTDREGGTPIFYYEAPDGENEALFAADYISRYLKEPSETDEPRRAAILYRTNSQSRLFEEALRRYGLKYNVVGGFSFYERAEIKDMISYLKLIQNPDDSIAFLRVVNTPARGIGKTTLETLERLSLETGVSMWSAMEQAIQQKLLPARAVAALAEFKQIIEDGRAMLAGSFVERLAADTASLSTQQSAMSTQPATNVHEEQMPSSPSEPGEADEDASFDFGLNDQHELFGRMQEGEVSEVADGMGETQHAASPRGSQSGLNTNQPPEPIEGFRAPGGAATLPEVIKFLIDRTGYIKVLEEEATPESYSRIENLQELVNAARDAADRAETLGEFLDHAALVSDTDQYDESSRVTLMTLHSAKGLEFPLVFLAGMEEGLFPSSRTFLNPEQIEEERRLCYVGMTRAMDTLVLSRARYRRRYGSDLPDASVPSRFLEEIPPQLMEEIGTSSRRSGTREPAFSEVDEGRHYSYEDEDQSAAARARLGRSLAAEKAYSTKRATTGAPYQSIDNIAEFFASRGRKFSRPKVEVSEPTGKRGFRPGQRVRHPKYGEGTVYKREGDGDEAKLTVQFPHFGIKKLVEKFAQLERL